MLGGFISLQVVWGQFGLAPQMYIFVAFSLLIFGVLSSPKLFGLHSELANKFSSTLLSVLSWSITRGSPAGAYAASMALILGTALGIIIAFIVSSSLFPQSATGKFLKSTGEVMALVRRHVRQSLTIMITDADCTVPAELSCSSPGHTSDDSHSSVEKGAVPGEVGEDVLNVRKIESDLWSVLQESNSMDSLLDSAQHECYVAVGNTYMMLPMWPCKRNHISKERYQAVGTAVRNMTIASTAFVNTGLSPEVAGRLKAQGFPVEDIEGIAKLLYRNICELEEVFRRSPEERWKTKLPPREILSQLQEAVMALFKAESKSRDLGLRGLSPGIKLDDIITWFRVLDAMEVATSIMTELHETAAAATVELPWFGAGTSMSSQERQRLRASVLAVADVYRQESESRMHRDVSTGGAKRLSREGRLWWGFRSRHEVKPTVVAEQEPAAARLAPFRLAPCLTAPGPSHQDACCLWLSCSPRGTTSAYTEENHWNCAHAQLSLLASRKETVSTKISRKGM